MGEQGSEKDLEKVVGLDHRTPQPSQASSQNSTPELSTSDGEDSTAKDNGSQHDQPWTQPKMSLVRETLFIIVLCSTQLFVQGSFGYILIPLRIVGTTFGQTSEADAHQLDWHVAGYSLTVGTFILVAGRLGDLYGSKKILIGGWFWFFAWSLIGGCSAFTGNAIFFDICRALQGIGPAFLLPNALAIAGRTYPPGMKKNVVFSLFALTAPLGCCTWGAIGSLLAELAWWPWTMWIGSIGCFIIGVLGIIVVPADEPVVDEGEEKQTFDFFGAVFGVLGLLLLNVSWVQAPVVGWQQPYVYTILILGFVFLGLFVWQERRARHPLLDMSIFNRHANLVLACTGLGWASFSVWFYYLFQFVQQYRNVSPLLSAAQFSPGAVSGIVAAVATAYLLRAIPAGWLMAIACAAFFAGSLLLALAPVHQSYWYNIFWSFVIEAWGMDISFPASATILSNAVPKKHQGVSASLVNTVVNYSIAIGLGIAGTVEVQLNDNGNDVLKGYRAAMWVAVALSGSALLLALSYASTMSFQEWRRERKAAGGFPGEK